ncbi:MAG: HAMP domain-containing histidine kinase [Actinobacteria bacterium]|nr:HAMP domain-containing histidine kinase [Actinomycetota bacterium]
MRAIGRHEERIPSLRQLLVVAGVAQLIAVAVVLWRAPVLTAGPTVLAAAAWIVTVCCLGLILRTVSAPLARLGAIARKVRAGELNGTTEVRGVREIHQLSAMLSDVLMQLRVLHERHQTQSALEANITRIAELVRQPRSLDAVLERTVRELASALPATEVIITLVEGLGDCSHAVWDTSGEVHIVHHADEDALDEARLIRAAIVHGDVIAVHDVDEYDFGDDGAIRAALRARGVQAVLVTPVYSGKTPLGAVVVNAARRATWPDASHRLVRAVARELAAAVQHTSAQRREQEMLTRLDALDRVQRDFITSVSDELRTPLLAIAASLERLDGDTAGRLDAEQRRVLRIVKIHSERLSAVLEGLLTLSRVESRAATATFSVVSVVPLIEGLRRYANNIRGDRQIALNFTEPPASLALLGDEAQVHRALANVVDNALKFTPDGGEVTVGVRASDRSIEFTIIDTGIGMSTDQQPRPLIRWLRPRGAEHGAGGIGLEIVRSVIEHHGGSVDVDSVPGAGTSVTLSFPRAGVPLRSLRPNSRA